MRRTLVARLVDPSGAQVSVGVSSMRTPGDFDLDGDVDGADLTKWQGDFGPNGGSDADGDNDSDGNDFLLWQRQLGSAPVVAVAAAVPEPAPLALILLAGCGLALALQRRR